ncbi:PQQ-binding-like beta-propeller repeat protein [Streptomyces sp. NPDC047928]|uniref:outer membrane protein assembly factor BamB family protein n=1 Tax=unclassified Streptomyces TaxID=2593676 RepID=UPI003713FE4A
MTQPPSQQPPQGGFGSPQDPHQGVPQPPAQPPQAPQVPPTAPPAAPGAGPGQPGYGYPQAPGQQPGYGYPQAPDQQPNPYAQQPGPYGQQPGPYAQQPGPYGQQPGPYGQQPGPYGQQPGPYGGYPTQPQYPGAPVPPPGGAPGGGNPFKGKPGVIVAAAVAGLLVVGAGTWWALSGDEEKDPVAKPTASAEPEPSGSESIDQGDGGGDGRNAADDLNAGRQPGEAKVEWLVKNDVDLPRNGSDVYGPWIVGDTIAKAMYKGVEGYSVTDGKKKWSVPFTTEVCTAPPAPAADGTIVVGIKDGTGDRAKCTQLQRIDLKTGKAGWKAQVPKGTGFNSLSDMTIAISGTTVTAAGTGNSYGYSLTDGKQLFGKPTSGCKPYAFAGGPKLIAAASCPTSDYDNPQHELQEVDPASGKPKWRYQLAKGWEVDKVYSVSPLVISATHRKDKKWSVVALTASGKLRSQLDGGKDKYQPQCGGGFVVFGKNLQGCVGVAADANTFYMATAPTSLTRGTNDVVAFNLDTGKATWRSNAGAERTMMPLRMEGRDVLLYMEGSWDKGGAVATLAPTGGAPKVLLQHPASTAKIERDFYKPKYGYADGRFFIVGGRVSARNDTEEKETKTMMAFGK